MKITYKGQWVQKPVLPRSRLALERHRWASLNIEPEENQHPCVKHVPGLKYHTSHFYPGRQKRFLLALSIWGLSEQRPT